MPRILNTNSHLPALGRFNQLTKSLLKIPLIHSTFKRLRTFQWFSQNPLSQFKANRSRGSCVMIGSELQIALLTRKPKNTKVSKGIRINRYFYIRMLNFWVKNLLIFTYLSYQRPQAIFFKALVF